MTQYRTHVSISALKPIDGACFIMGNSTRVDQIVNVVQRLDAERQQQVLNYVERLAQSNDPAIKNLLKMVLRCR